MKWIKRLWRKARKKGKVFPLVLRMVELWPEVKRIIDKITNAGETPTAQETITLAGFRKEMDAAWRIVK